MPTLDNLPDIVQRFGIQAVAAVLNVTPSAISQWHRVPLSRVVILTQAFGISPAEIRPDLFDKGTTIAEAAQYQIRHDPRSRSEMTRIFRKKIKDGTVTIRRAEWQAVKELALAGASGDQRRALQKILRHQKSRGQKIFAAPDE